MTQSTILTRASTRTSKRRYAHFATGLAFIIFPLASIFIYAAHPNILSLQPVHDVDAWIAEWHNNDLLHFAHVLMLFCTPLLIAISIDLMKALLKKGRMYGFFGGILAIIGAVFLAADKGALCLVTSAFDSLSASEFEQIYPAIVAMKHLEGWLWLVYGFILIPVGFIVMGIGLYRSQAIPSWQAGALILGSALLINPDIEIISLMASIVLAIGMIPIGLARIQTSFISQ